MDFKVQGIYTILNIVNNKCYIGSSIYIKGRKEQHIRELRRNKHANDHLQKAWLKYGEQSFVFAVIEVVGNRDLLYTRECFWIENKKSLNGKYGYNLGVPTKSDNLSPRKETIDKLILANYHQWYGDNPKISLEEFLNGKRAKDLIEKLGPQNKKVVFGFNKVTGIKEFECESVAATSIKLQSSENLISRVLDKYNKTCKGFILVSQDKYDFDKEYKWVSKQKIPIKKECFKGNPVETFDLITNDTTQQFTNKHEMSEYYNVSVKYINKVFGKEKKSLKGFGVRYTSKRPYILKTKNP